MNNLLEKYLQKPLTWHMHGPDCEVITHEEALRRNNNDVESIRQRVKDDFIIYRYYMNNNTLIKECFYMQFSSISYDGVIRYKSCISDSNKSTMKIDEIDFPKLMGPVCKLHKYVYRFDEDDAAVIRFFFNENLIRKRELTKELMYIDKTLDYLLNLEPSAI